jgi:aryl-alcohol dehydrogenase-like predicted oxidoreductase
MPRFSADNQARNLGLLDEYRALAREAGCSTAQLALAFVLHRGDHVVVIPGTTRITHLEDNLGAARVSLSRDLVDRLDALINQHTVAGDRYNAATQAEIDTENFA